MAAVYRAGTGSRVVRRGRARELLVDGTFASTYTPGHAVTGSVWDALACAVCALPPRRRRSIALLGLGGGSAARVVRALAPRARIVGVELDPSVIRLARRWLDLDAIGVEVTRADARAWLESARGPFDAVLEDVFVGTGRSAVKPDGLPEPGLGRAARLVARGGILASNALDEARAVACAVRARFPHVVRIDVEDYDNRVFVGSRLPLTGRGLRSAVAATPLLAETLPRLAFGTLPGADPSGLRISGPRRGSGGRSG